MRKMVVFEMDNTILQGRFIDTCAKKYNFRQALALLQNIDKNAISLAKRTASFLKGKSIEELENTADDMALATDIHNVIKRLKQRNYIVGIVTDSYQLVARHIAQKIGADFHLSYNLAVSDGIATGDVTIPSYFYYSEMSSCDHPVCRTNALRHACRQHDVSMHNCIVVGHSENDLCMVRHAGVGLAYIKPDLVELFEYAR
jgi:glucosyl-3-phosphoglycerate synthase